MNAAFDEKLPIWLKEILDNGHIAKRFSLFTKKAQFTSINKFSRRIEHWTSLGEHDRLRRSRKRVAFFRDGPFLSNDITTGAIVSLLGEMDALADKGYDVYLFYCFRGWSDPVLYAKQKFTTIFIRPDDFYSNAGLIRGLVSVLGISICQFDSAEAICLQADFVRPEANVVFEVHNVEYDLLAQLECMAPEIDYIKNKEMEALKRSDLVLVRSSQDLALLNKLKTTRFNVRIFRGCINTDRIRFVERAKARRKILFLGHLNYAPNVQAVKIICTRIAPKVDGQFIIVGAGSERLKKTYTNANVTFLGYVHNLNAIFAQVDIGLAPIFTGSGTRLKILDYMASGVPVIGTERSIEGLEDGIRKAMIVEDDIKEYPKLIQGLLEDETVLKFLSRKGHRFVTRNRNWKRCIDDIIKGYKTLYP